MRPEIYIPQAFRNFQGFSVKDVEEWCNDKRIEIHWERIQDKDQYCRVMVVEVSSFPGINYTFSY